MTPREVILAIEKDKPRVMAIIARFAYTYERASDLMQTGYLQVLKLRPESDIDCPYKYFITVCRRLAADERKSLEAQAIHINDAPSFLEDLHDPTPSAETMAEYEQEVSRILNVIEKLSPRCRRVFEMAYVEGYIYEEIAKQFRVSESMVKKYLATARQRIASHESKFHSRHVSPRSGGSTECRKGIAKSLRAREAMGGKT